MEKLKFKYLDLKYREEMSTNTDSDLIKDEVNFYNEYYYRLDFFQIGLIDLTINITTKERIMQLNLKDCTEMELMSYKIILLHHINDHQDVIKKIDKELIKLKKGNKNAQTKN